MTYREWALRQKVARYSGDKALTLQEEIAYLRRWGAVCMTCGQEVEEAERVLNVALIPLDNKPAHVVDDEYKHYYMQCRDCMEQGVEL